MKKTIFISILILLFSVTMVYPGNTCKKKIKYKDVEQFMADYYYAYNQYSQDASTIDLMDRYWAPEFLSFQYLPLPEPLVMDLTSWKNFLVGVHSQFIETLTVEEMSIDIRNLTAVARLTIEMTDRASGVVVLSIGGVGFYNLKVVKKKKLKMTSLKLYFSDPEALMALSGPPPGI